MVESLTQNYHWTKPEVTKSASTWGGFLNTDLDSIDALVFANQQGTVPVGAVTMFAGATAPANWLICDGRSLDTTAYAALFAVLQYAHGGSGANFNLPNLKGAFPLGAGAGSQINVGVGAVGGEANHVLSAAELASHAHGVSDPTHTHGAYQNSHNHGIITGSHSHGVTDPGHVHGGVLNVVGVPGWNSQGAASPLIAQTGTPTAVTNISIQAAGNLGGNTDVQTPAIGVYAAGTGIAVAAAGGNAGHNNIPPFVALNFIIRFS